MGERVAVVDATLFDSASGVLHPQTTIVIEGERIAAVTQKPIAVDGAQRIDVGGRVVLPGLIDARVHATAVSHDVLALSMQPPSLITAQSKGLLEAMLLRGFTSVLLIVDGDPQRLCCRCSAGPKPACT